jgi:hypothetical protein
MDTWKPIRLVVCIGLIVAFLAVGILARLVWGVPDAPYGWRDRPWLHNSGGKPYLFSGVPKDANPFAELEWQMRPKLLPKYEGRRPR